MIRASCRARFWRNSPTLCCAALLMWLGLLTAPALAQSVGEFGTTSRGRAGSDPLVLAAAQEAMDRAGQPCRVTNGRGLGRDATGASHYEVACEDSTGFIVIAAPRYEAFSCLVFAASGGPVAGTRCRLPENSRPLDDYTRLAEQAGARCTVDGGRLVGRSSAGKMIFEIGCQDTAGYWLEQDQEGWRVTDCLTVAAQGGECRLTTRAEERMAFEARLAGTELDACAVSAFEIMGRGSEGTYVEVLCGDGWHVVARFGDGDRLEEVIPCAQARRIGSGCQLIPVED